MDPEYVKEKDINEMILSGKSKSEIQKIINENVYSGIKSQNTIRILEKGRIKK